MYKYEIIPTEGIIVQKLIGNTTIQDLKELYHQTRTDPDFSIKYTYVTDFRDAILNLSIDELKKAADFLMQHNKTLVKTALLVNRSVDTAKIMIFRDHLDQEFYFPVYSTLEAASNFLKIDLNPYLDDDVSIREDVYM